jgi:hypothetical protein
MIVWPALLTNGDDIGAVTHALCAAPTELVASGKQEERMENTDMFGAEILECDSVFLI